MLPNSFRQYFKDIWNLYDQVMYFVLILAVVLRFTLNKDSRFEWARNVYAFDLILFCLRILQLYLVHPYFGPKIIMIWRMVGIGRYTSDIVDIGSDDSV